MNAASEAVRDATRLTRLLTVLNDAGDLDILLERALSTLSELFSAEVVVLLDPAGTGSFEPLASIGLPEDLAEQPFCGEAAGNVARAMRDGGPLLIQDATTDESIEPQLRELEVETVLYLPVSASHAARGVLILARCRAEPFVYAEVGLLTAMAYRIGHAVEQAQRRAQLERIVRSERTIGADLEELGVARKAVQTFPDLVGADGATLAMFDETGVVRYRADFGEVTPSEDCLGRLLPRLLATSNLAGFEPWDATLTETETDGRDGGAVLVFPIGRDRLEGVLCAFRATATPFDPDLRPIGLLFAGQTSAALENARLYRAVHNELSDRRRAERALKASEERLAALIRSVHDLIVVFDAAGGVRYSNPAAATIWSNRDGGGTVDFWPRICPRDVGRLREIVGLIERAPGETRTCSIGLLTDDGRRHDYDVVLTNLLEEPSIGGIVATFHDVTERKSYELRLEDLAFRDPLTGLANRAHFQDRLRRVLTSPDDDGRSVAVIFFDLDNFKVVNDSLGHEAGDVILKTVAERMRVVLRHDDLGARLGGDEFTVLLEAGATAETARTVALRLLDAIREPVTIAGRDVVVGGSFGIALGVAGRDSVEDLLRKADVAMYHAKANGKNACALFDDSLEIAAMRRLEAETELRQALASNQLDVFFQPIMSLTDGRLHAAEALVRWRHPERGLIGPHDFIPVAEATGLIVDLGRRVIETSFARHAEWRDTAGRALPLSIYLSPKQLRHEGLVDEIAHAARRFGVDPRAISLEITENSLIRSGDAAIAAIERLRALGFLIAIDDFGTGYSSLSYLKELPVDVVKIDRAFIRNLAADPRDAAVVDSIVRVAAAFGLETIAEGVETEAQATILDELGCRLAQGFLWSPALPAGEFARMLPLLAGDGRTTADRRRNAVG